MLTWTPIDTLDLYLKYEKFELSVPVFIGSGEKDRDTPLRMQAALIKTACTVLKLASSCQ